MRLYCTSDLENAFAQVGLKKGDLVYLSTRLYGVGKLKGVNNRERFLECYFDILMSLLGPTGTLVVPTFTQQVGRFGLPYVHEETVSLTGMFGEYIRKKKDSLRTLHPVFSVSAIGALKEEICNEVSPVAFGFDSAFDRMVRMGGKSVCIGFDYYSGHIVTLVHYVETIFGVPYYYNKLLKTPVYQSGICKDESFVINVNYRDLKCCYNFNSFIDFMASRNEIKSSPIGDSFIYAVNMRDVVNNGIALLKQDIHAFLEKVPEYQDGKIPIDGPEFSEQTISSNFTNWEGFSVGRD